MIMAAISFHETKNYTMGEGGALLIRDPKNVRSVRRSSGKRERTEASFSADRLTNIRWVDAGSSYLPSDMNAAYLYAQLEVCDQIQDKRMGNLELLSSRAGSSLRKKARSHGL